MGLMVCFITTTSVF